MKKQGTKIVYGVFTRKNAKARWMFQAEYDERAGAFPELNAMNACQALTHQSAKNPNFAAQWVKMWSGEKSAILRELNRDDSDPADKAALDWVTRAVYVSKDKEDRPTLQAVYADTKRGKTLAADGFRLHMVDRVLPGVDGKREYPNWHFIVPDPSRADLANWSCGAVKRDELIHAVKVCAVFARESMNTVHFSANGSLTLFASSAESGDRTSVVPNTHAGIEFETAFNTKYLAEALAGMPNLVKFFQRDATSPMLLRGEMPSGEVRTAVLMPMHIGR